MNPPPPPSPSSSSAFASVPMVAITVVGILATFVVLASYYAFVTKCHLVRSLSARQRRRREPSVIRTVTAEDRGLGPPLIHMIPIVKFAAADGGGSGAAAAPRISVSECAVCLSEFEEQERVRLLPNCSHAFHIDCIDTWLQGNTRCPFCRRDITLPVAGRAAAAALASCSSEHQELSNRIVIELGSGHEEWTSHASNRRARRKASAESLGDEAIDTRTSDAEFAVQPMRRSLSMDSCCDKQLYLSVQEILTQRQV